MNIFCDVDVKFYSYRMPLFLAKIEGKGNVIKTVVPNMADITRALSRPPTYLTKLFSCELGAQTPFNDKNERYIVVNGVFIDKFVLCCSCKIPEMDLLILEMVALRLLSGIVKPVLKERVST